MIRSREFHEDMGAWELTRVAERHPARNSLLLAAAAIASALAIGTVARSVSPYPELAKIERMRAMPLDAVTSSADPERLAAR